MSRLAEKTVALLFPAALLALAAFRVFAGEREGGVSGGGGDYSLHWGQLLPERIKILADFDYRGLETAPAVRRESSAFRDRLLVADEIHLEQNLVFSAATGRYELASVLATARLRGEGRTVRIRAAIDEATGELHLARYGLSSASTEYYVSGDAAFAPVTWFASVLPPGRSRVAFNVGDLPVSAERMPRDWLKFTDWTHRLLLGQPDPRASLLRLEAAIESTCRPVPLICGRRSAVDGYAIARKRVEGLLAEHADHVALAPSWASSGVSRQGYLEAVHARLLEHLSGTPWASYAALRVGVGPWSPEWIGVLGRPAPAAVKFEEARIAVDLDHLSPIDVEIFLFHELSHLAQKPAPASAREAELFAWERTFAFVAWLEARHGLESPLFDSIAYAKDSFGLQAWVDAILSSRSKGRD